ncbi:hypothetical protein BU52_33355 [Streptomyces toyocaensis]|uniref:Uncharacterized protein n=1 Tax=Streptomyces toyocaensis TaxID=55952 RepID=A0A081XH85_STRTO|nr:hypothetical protein BU52_33355 [Streptomyces toyocaensis]
MVESAVGPVLAPRQVLHTGIGEPSGEPGEQGCCLHACEWSTYAVVHAVAEREVVGPPPAARVGRRVCRACRRVERVVPGEGHQDKVTGGDRLSIHLRSCLRYRERAVRKYPQRGDISARTALTIHRGTANQSAKSRPVLVLGMDGPEATNGERHDMAVTCGYWDALPDRVRRHLDCAVVEKLTPVTQKHTIEGLVMGDA